MALRAPAGAIQTGIPWSCKTNHEEPGMDRQKDMAVEAPLEHLIAHGANDIATVFARAFELAMHIERELSPGAGHYERTASQQGYANGTRPKRIGTPVGTVTIQIPKTAGHENAPFYPRSLKRGLRSVRAIMLAVASRAKTGRGQSARRFLCWFHR